MTAALTVCRSTFAGVKGHTYQWREGGHVVLDGWVAGSRADCIREAGVALTNRARRLAVAS